MKEITGHWKKHYSYKYLGSQDLSYDKDVIATIDRVYMDLVEGNSGQKKECVLIKFSELEKPMVINKVNSKAISRVSGSYKVEDWRGVRVSIFVQPNTKAFGDIVDALRIRAIAPQIDRKASQVDIDKAIEAMKDCKNLEELKVTYTSLSGQLKKDDQVLKFKDELKELIS